MKYVGRAIISFISLFILAACGATEEKKEVPAVKEESTVGFEMANGKIEEAQNVPIDEREAIIAAFDEYIEAFNAQDIERYIATLSHDPKGFNIEEERKALISAFDTYDVERIAEDVTIVKYSEAEANVFATLKVDLVEKETGADLSSVGRQVTVFKKEEDVWKVSSVYYIGSE
jgi:ketosteroid isomerase-like protein